MVRAFPPSVTGNPLYVINFVTDLPASTAAVIARVVQAGGIQIESISDIPRGSPPFNLVVIAHGNDTTFGLSRTRTSKAFTDRDAVVTAVANSLGAEGSAGILACICGGAAFEQSVSTDRVDWNGRRFGSETAAGFIAYFEQQL